MVVRCGAGGVADTEEACGDGVDGAGVEFVEVAFVVDEDGALEGLFGEGVVADAVVGEVVEDFQGEEEAGGWDVGVPGEDGAVDDLDVFAVASGRRGFLEVLLLEGGEGWGDFDDFELCAGVDFGVGVADVVEDVEHEGAVASTHFVDD